MDSVELQRSGVVKVSVAMITYKHASFITQALDSVLEQEAPFDFEVVVGDDASPDETPAILQEYASQYPEKIQLTLRTRNVGMHQNLEETLGACRGDYVALLEGDDYWTSPHKLARQAAFMDANPSIALSFHPVDILHEASVHVEVPDLQGAPAEVKFERLVSGNCISTCSVMFRRSLFTGYPDWFYGLKMADWPLFILLASLGDVRSLPYNMAAYRVHTGGVWSTKPAEFNAIESVRVLHALSRNLPDRFVDFVIPVCRASENYVFALLSEKTLRDDYVKFRKEVLSHYWCLPLKRRREFFARLVELTPVMQIFVSRVRRVKMFGAALKRRYPLGRRSLR